MVRTTYIIFGGLGHTTTAGRKIIFYGERERESCLDEIIEEARGEFDKREKAYICPAIQRDPIIHISTKQQSKIICPAWLFFSGCSGINNSRYASCREASSSYSNSSTRDLRRVAFLFHLQVLLGCKVGQHTPLLLARSRHL